MAGVTGQVRLGRDRASPGSPRSLLWGLCRLQDGTVHLVYGILEQPLPSLEAINTSGLRTGLQRVQLLKPNISAPPLPADVLTMEIRAPDIVIPGQETTYWCYMTELPEGFSRHHIVMVRGDLGPVPRPACREPAPSWGAVRGPGRTGCPLIA